MKSRTEFIEFVKGADAVIFDIDDTLIRTTHADKLATNSFLTKLNEELLQKNKPILSLSELRTLFQEIKDSRDQKQRIYNVDYPLIEKLFTRLGYDPRGYRNRVCELKIEYTDTFNKNLALYPDVKPFMERIIGKSLAEGGPEADLWPLGIISNGDSYVQREKLARLKIIDKFGSVIISEDLRDNRGKVIEKPNPRIFELSLEDLEAEPGKSIYIGDRVDKDIPGAKEAGIFTVRINRRDGKYSDREPECEAEEPDYKLNSLKDIYKSL